MDRGQKHLASFPCLRSFISADLHQISVRVTQINTGDRPTGTRSVNNAQFYLHSFAPKFLHRLFYAALDDQTDILTAICNIPGCGQKLRRFSVDVDLLVTKPELASVVPFIQLHAEYIHIEMKARF